MQSHAGMSDIDDDVVSIFSFRDGTTGDSEAETVERPSGQFFEEVESAQRLGIMRNQAEYIRGSMETADMGKRPWTPEKMFHVPRLYTWTSGTPDELIDDLRRDRVRARLQANTGLGKSTRLAPMLARELNCRVLVVSLDAAALRQTSEFVRATGLGRFRRHWTGERKEWVCCMTYADYVGRMHTAARSTLNANFEITIFDEAFEGSWAVFSAKRAFAAFASAQMSLLLCSATISSDVKGNSAGADAMTNFRVVEEDLTLKRILSSGKLLAEHCVDRAYVVLPTDTEVAEAADYYEAAGVTALRLDSAASYVDMTDVVAALKGDAVSPRVVIMHARWAIGFNMELEFGIVRPFRGYWAPEGGVWREHQTPMSEEMVLQAQARTGRGIAKGSSGYVMGTSRSEADELYASDVDKAFFSLCAMSIKPGQHPRWADCYRRYPDAIPAPIAHMVLKVNLPPAIAVKFIAEDGLFASKYSMALSMFTQTGHYLMASDHAEPKERESWVLDDYMGVTGSIEATRCVPVHAVGELQVVLHGVIAHAEGDIELARWVPESPPPIGDYESTAGVSGSTPPRLRRVATRVTPPKAPEAPVDAFTGLRLTTPALGPAGTRRARIMDSDRMREALAILESTLSGSVQPVSPVEVKETPEGTMACLEVGTVNSPGGSVVCELPAQICVDMNEGRELAPDAFLLVMRTVRSVIPQFAASRLFDGFAGPWDSFYKSFLSDAVMASLRRTGELTLVYQLSTQLRQRFDFELANVLARSNITRSFFVKLFPRMKPGVQRLMHEISLGRFDRFGQSRYFFDRVKYLRTLMDATLVQGERIGYYLPNAVSDAQRSLAMGLPQVVGAGVGRWAPVEDNLASRFSLDRQRGKFA